MLMAVALQRSNAPSSASGSKKCCISAVAHASPRAIVSSAVLHLPSMKQQELSDRQTGFIVEGEQRL